MAKLSGKARANLPSSSFAEPGARKYPVPDASHARNALARVSQFGSPKEKALVASKVKARFPAIAVKAPSLKLKGPSVGLKGLF